MKKVTLEKIGNELNISKVAVFKALNDQPGISPELRQSVKLKAKEMGYEFAPVKTKFQLNFIYLIKKNFFLATSEQFYTSIYYYLNLECEKFNHKLSIVFFEDNDAELKSLRNKLEYEKIAGIYVAGEVDTETLARLQDLSTPIVFIDFYSPLYNFNYVFLDSYHLSYIATNYLVSKGHTQIGFVGDIQSTSSICDRYLGYIKAMTENFLEVQHSWHINKNIEHLMEINYSLPDIMPTAFICHCDSAAYKMYMILNHKGFNIPNDISLISFDNTDLCESISPKLTSLGTTKSSYARKSFNLMHETISTNKKSTVFLKSSIIERESVKDLTSKNEELQESSKTNLDVI